jgi:hypothetical protein
MNGKRRGDNENNRVSKSRTGAGSSKNHDFDF